MERLPHVERRLFGVANHELAAAQDQMLILGCKTAREKLASFLLMLLKRAPLDSSPDNTITIPMTRALIADYLGLTTETVSRTFTRLKQERLIGETPEKIVRPLEFEALTEIAEGF